MKISVSVLSLDYSDTKKQLDEIKKHLRASAANLEKWLSEIDDRGLLERIEGIAKEIDLAASKMKMIEARLGKE